MEKSTSNMKNITKHVSKLFNKAIEKAFPMKDFQSVVTWTTTGGSDLSCPSAIKIFSMNQKKEGWNFPSSKEVASEILDNIPTDPMIKSITLSQLITAEKKDKKPKKEEKEPKEGDKKKKVKENLPSYFIDIILNDDYLIDTASDVLKNGIKVDVEEHTCRKVLVDFSSPNIAKEMHVGHLRSTIIGESICRILEFLNFDVERINHIGDWGTQFGMLIANLEENYPDFLTNKPELKELEHFYVESKKKFDENPEFKKKAYENTVKLQAGDENKRLAWKFFCEESKKEYDKIYERLNITLKDLGESFYDPLARELIPQLEKDGIVKLDQGAKVMHLDGFKVPLMVVKSDGGFTYDSSDLTAVVYRLKEIKKNWIIYVVGAEQSDHLKAIFQAAKQLGLHTPPTTRIDHMAFGMMLNEDGGKIATRKGGLVKLSDLLDAAKEKAKEELIKRNGEQKFEMSPEEIESSSAKIGYSAVKYFDLKQTRENNYKFSYTLMLDPKGNTAVYLFYNYVRICSVFRKLDLQKENIDKLIDTEKIKIVHQKERELLIALLKFNDVIDEVLSLLAINKLADYVYVVCTKFSEFFDECRIKDSDNMTSRILLLELTRRFLSQSFHLLGLTPVDRI